MAGYPFDVIEPRWQEYWDENESFKTRGPGDEGFDATKPKYYVLDMFPYPSGAGLHVGHPEGYTATDIVARYKRMRGFNVLHPMGWDAFGLPAEQYAIETGTHPADTTRRNIDRFREQLQRLGFSYDWSRELSTTDPEYYRWTQWIFLKLFERGLAYESEVPVNWCPALKTVLANEEVIDGKSERGGHPVIQVPMRQWMLRITRYAEQLLTGLDDLDWPESVKEMQRNWIGRSEGAEVDFRVVGRAESHIRVFTTRPDTLFGATYMVLAPEHPLVNAVTSDERRQEVEAYIEQTRRKTERDRLEQRTKTGVFTGGHAVNPVTGDKLPVWIADYVLSTYGTGAIMAVPAHDERDFEFATKYGLPIREVIEGGTKNEDGRLQSAFSGEGRLINSSSADRAIAGISDSGPHLSDLSVADAKRAVIEWLESNGVGRGRVNYKLRDWLFSRQRYWGEPFPLILVDGLAKPLPDDSLPVTLPSVESFTPAEAGESPLAAAEKWVETTDPETGKPARRETNTMPQWAGSCWYYLRYIDPRNNERLVDEAKEQYWMPVDLYVGGAEHAVLHLLYARFWHKVLFDAGVVSTSEPFGRLVNQGMILGEVEYTAYRIVDDSTGDLLSFISSEHAVEDDTRGDDAGHTHLDSRGGALLRAVKVEDQEVEKSGDSFVLRAFPGVRVDARAHKMSKSRGNVVNPDDIVDEYGADSLRLYEMFMGPLEQVKPWNTRSVEGVHRFLSRTYRLLLAEGGEQQSDRVTDGDASSEQLRILHQTIKRVSEDIEGLRLNTAIAAMMEFINAAFKWEAVPKAVARDFTLLLAPFAPHLAEQIWRALGHPESLTYTQWPEWDESLLVEDQVSIAVQVNGKLRGTIEVAHQAEKETVLEAARAQENVARYLDSGTLRKEVYVPGRLVNFVVS